ncbi:MAG TPA: TetR/AcrR family transcriptional regulator [Flavobacterium sp.]|nr:TetR/AcrR family transcriptional regulator [Flavobacterium sp.]
MEKDDEKKPRKRTSGVIKDKERTKSKMIQAVGRVISKKGYSGLNATSIAKECGVDKRLVWTYFGSVDNLIEEYITQRDFWKYTAKDSINTMFTSNIITKEQVNDLLQHQFDTLLSDKILQRIIHWEIGENKPFLRSLADQRELMGEGLFQLVEPRFSNSPVNIRAVTALLISGIYYLSLHGKINGSLFCGLDINIEKDKIEISKAIEYLIYHLFEFADDNQI